jgi:lysophospholipase L1-like esterase
MTRFVSILICLFLTLMGFARVQAQEVAAAADFDLVRDAQGNVWLGRIEGSALIVSRWTGETWRDVQRLENQAIHGPLSLCEKGDGVAALFGETTDGRSRLVITCFGETEPKTFRPAALIGDFQQYDAAPGAGGRLVILAVENENGISKLRLMEFDLSGGVVIEDKTIARTNHPSHPSVLPGKPQWLCWQESSEGRLRIAIGYRPANGQLDIRSFAVKGFGGLAAPTLVRDSSGLVHLVWQGQDRSGKAVPAYRSVTADKLGLIRLLTGGDEFAGIIGPEAAAGAEGIIAAYGYAGGRWNAVKLGFKPDGRTELKSRSYPDGHIRLPRLAVDGAGKEVWAWPEESAAGGLIRTVTGERLQSSPPEYIPPRRKTPQPQAEVVRILAFGDSITAGLISTPDKSYYLTAGYTDDLLNEYTSRIATAEIVQSGLSGEDTYEGLVRLPAVLQENWRFTYVLILEGTNDAFGGFLPANVAENLGKMADMVRGTGAIPVVATLLPRFDSPKKEIAEEISRAIYPMTGARGITICDFQALYPKNPLLFSDLRLHPNDEGYTLMAKYWLEALVTFEGDINRSFAIDQEDLLLMTAILGNRRGGLSFNPDADFNDDGHLDVLDLSRLLSRLGKTF